MFDLKKYMSMTSYFYDIIKNYQKVFQVNQKHTEMHFQI